MNEGQRARIRALMGNMSVRGLAADAGIAFGTLRKILDGETDDPDLQTLEKIAGVWGITVAEMLDPNGPTGLPIAARRAPEPVNLATTIPRHVFDVLGVEATIRLTSAPEVAADVLIRWARNKVRGNQHLADAVQAVADARADS